MHAEINCLLNAGQKLSSFRGMTLYSTLIPCNMCAGAIVQFGITKVLYWESRNFPEGNGRELLVRYGVGAGRPGPRGGQADAQGLH